MRGRSFKQLEAAAGLPMTDVLSQSESNRRNTLSEEAQKKRLARIEKITTVLHRCQSMCQWGEAVLGLALGG